MLCGHVYHYAYMPICLYALGIVYRFSQQSQQYVAGCYRNVAGCCSPVATVAAHLAASTIAEWLETKEKLHPDLLEQAREGYYPPLSHYRETAHSRPQLQKPLAEKVAKEDLTTAQIRTVAQALRLAVVLQ